MVPQRGHGSGGRTKAGWFQLTLEDICQGTGEMTVGKAGNVLYSWRWLGSEGQKHTVPGFMTCP